MLTYVSELDILLATILWLHDEGWTVESISIAKGRGLPSVELQKQKLIQELRAANVPFDEMGVFTSKGPDIVAQSPEGIWKIECKGLSKAASSTHRNQLDRAMASVVSYFDTPETRLGLAIAND